jgi:hypothetical protein
MDLQEKLENEIERMKSQRDKALARVAELESERSALISRVCNAERRSEERDLYLGALNRCASAAGNPDPATGCRLVIFYVKEVTE